MNVYNACIINHITTPIISVVIIIVVMMLLAALLLRREPGPRGLHLGLPRRRGVVIHVLYIVCVYIYIEREI